MTSFLKKKPYLDNYGLKEDPYTTKPDERYLYLTDQCDEAINMVARIIQNREGAGLIVGEKGTGKTTVMKRLFNLLASEKDCNISVIETAEHAPTLFQLVKEIMEGFNQECSGQDTKTRVDTLKKFLFEEDKKGKYNVVFIDEAQQLPAKMFESLRGLLNFEGRSGKLLQIILYAMPSMMTKKLPYAKSFANRLTITTLEPMNRRDVEDMLKWRFKQARGTGFPFSTAIIDYIFKKTHGNPRSICGIAQLALEFSIKKPIDEDLINEICKKKILD